MRRLLPDEAETTVAEQLAELDLTGARACRPALSGAQLRHHARRPRGDRREVGTDRQRHRHRDAAAPAHPGRRGDDRRRARCAPSATGGSSPTRELRAYREQTGLAHDPLGVIVSNRLDLPWDAGAVHRRRRAGRDLHRLRRGAARDGDAGDGRPPRRRGRRSTRRSSGCGASAASARCSAREARTCTATCARAGLADELFLTIAPKLAGGEGARILEGALPRRRRPRARLAARVRGRALRPLPRQPSRVRPVAFSVSGLQARAPRSSRCWSASRRSWTSTSIRSRPRRSRRSTTRSSRASPIPQILVEMRAKAKRGGALEPFIARRRATAPGLTNWEYGILCEQMGRSPVAAPMAFNCSAPDTGQHGDPRRPRHRRAEGSASSSRCSRGDPQLLLDDRARGLRLGPDHAPDPRRARRRRVGDQRAQVVHLGRHRRRVRDRDGGHRPRRGPLHAGEHDPRARSTPRAST